jgi:putative copper export protein
VDISADTIRTFLHILAVSVWVGGQIVLGALVPVLRQIGSDAPKLAAQQFNKVAWPFFGLAVVTGIWNVLEIDNMGDRSTGYQVALFLKIVLVALSGIGAFLHTQATSRSALAVWGAVGGATALLAVLFGAILATNF